MKSTNKERFQILDLIKGYALFNPEIGFELKIDNKLNFKCSAKSNIKQRLIDVFGKSALDVMLPLDYNTGDLKISGFTSLPEFNRSDKRFYFTAINGRLLKCPVIRSAIDKVYRDILPAKKYPILVLNLELARADLDVNVHPRKQEVKYQNTNHIYKTLIDAIYSSISDHIYSSHHQLSLNTVSEQSAEPVKVLAEESLPEAVHNPIIKPKLEKLFTPKFNFDFEANPKKPEDIQKPMEDSLKKEKSFLERFPAFELYKVALDFQETDIYFDSSNEFILFVIWETLFLNLCLRLKEFQRMML